MGKKKKPTKKTKQLSVAIAEASSSAPLHQIATPRKRGRPRKIAEKIEKTEEEEPPVEDAVHESAEQIESNKRIKIAEPEEETGTTSFMGEEEEDQSSSKEPRRSTRARRKSKPRKSS